MEQGENIVLLMASARDLCESLNSSEDNCIRKAFDRALDAGWENLDS